MHKKVWILVLRSVLVKIAYVVLPISAYLSLMPKQGISRMLMNSGIRLIPNVRELIRISTCMV